MRSIIEATVRLARRIVERIERQRSIIYAAKVPRVKSLRYAEGKKSCTRSWGLLRFTRRVYRVTLITSALISEHAGSVEEVVICDRARSSARGGDSPRCRCFAHRPRRRAKSHHSGEPTFPTATLVAERNALRFDRGWNNGLNDPLAPRERTRFHNAAESGAK